MPKKGHTNNPNGRPAGTPNKCTRELRKALRAILAKEFEKLPDILETLEPADRIQSILKMLPYIVPKMPDMPPSFSEEDPEDLAKDKEERAKDRELALRESAADRRRREAFVDIF